VAIAGRHTRPDLLQSQACPINKNFKSSILLNQLRIVQEEIDAPGTLKLMCVCLALCVYSQKIVVLRVFRGM